MSFRFSLYYIMWTCSNKKGVCISWIQSDHGKEFENECFQSFCEKMVFFTIFWHLNIIVVERKKKDHDKKWLELHWMIILFSGPFRLK